MGHYNVRVQPHNSKFDYNGLLYEHYAALRFGRAGMEKVKYIILDVI